MSGCFVGRKGENYGAKTPLEAGSQRGPARPGVGAAPPVPAPNTGGLPTEMGARLLSSSGMLQRPVLVPPQPPSVPRQLPGTAEAPPRLWGSPVGPPYQARIPCNVEMPAFPCGMGVCTEFKSPTLKFMKLLLAAEGCMGCTEG